MEESSCVLHCTTEEHIWLRAYGKMYILPHILEDFGLVAVKIEQYLGRYVVLHMGHCRMLRACRNIAEGGPESLLSVKQTRPVSPLLI